MAILKTSVLLLVAAWPAFVSANQMVFRNATIHTVSGDVISNGAMLIDNGRILTIINGLDFGLTPRTITVGGVGSGRFDLSGGGRGAVLYILVHALLKAGDALAEITHHFRDTTAAKQHEDDDGDYGNLPDAETHWDTLSLVCLNPI